MLLKLLVRHRPYRPALGLKEALKKNKAYRGSLYAPKVVDACIELFEKKFQWLQLKI
jgi:response regulator RpfG family c-di-GMP phosphodiesterase